MRRLAWFVAAATTAFGVSLAGDEGMWTFDNVPRELIKARLGVEVGDAWLDPLRSSVVRLESGCTGSLVSGEGLVLTNHHCVQTCAAQNSSATDDLMAKGFLAGTRAEERRCQDEQVSVLVGMEQVTAQVVKATSGLSAAEANARRRQELTRLEQACEDQARGSGTPLKCEAVALYEGGQHWLYKYRRYADVRLVFAPEEDVAAFGGDPDNFQFPRWCLDMGLLRVYENGTPASTPTHLQVAWDGAPDGAPVFVAGHPGSTDRQLTVAELQAQRDVFLPFWLIRFSELRGRLIQYGKTSPEAARIAQDLLDGIENSLKVRRQEMAALLDDSLMARKTREEAELRERVMADAGLRAVAGDAWDQIATARRTWRDLVVPYVFLEVGHGFYSELFAHARHIVRAADERAKPNTDRLRGFTDAQLPQVEQTLRAATPIYPEFEQVRLSWSLERMREWLGPDDPLVRRVFGSDSPDRLARRLVEGTRLADPAVRLALYEGGAAAVAATDDPMIQLARAVDPRARELRAKYEAEVEGPSERAHEAIAAARFAVYGTTRYPDATFTLRLSYGTVRGWTERGQPVDPFTRLARLYERATGAPPFLLPPRWVEAKPRLDLSARANFVTTNDIVGGNSGSPMVDATGRIVGLVFDGNIHSIAGSYWFDETLNRTVAVHPDFIRVALTQVYPATHLARELGVK
jgi:V8-like Glu-specific endopeptidase